MPSIDLRGGSAVQLVGGEVQKLDAGDPRPIARRFSIAGEIAVVDLDAALGTGTNAGAIEELVRSYPCRVGGGIRSVESAIRWLDAGATRVVLGTAATPEVLRQLPRERVVVALDARDGEVVVKGWRERTGVTVEQRLRELDALAGEFLVTFVEREGRLGGTSLDRVRSLAKIVDPRRLTIAGGVTTLDEVAELDRIGCRAQVGMALYEGVMDLADAIVAPLRSDRPDGLWPTVVCDERGTCLGLAYSNGASVREAVRTQRGVYFSRSRGALWEKGGTSGDTQELLRIDADCDRDALRFTVRQHGSGFCHAGTRTCFGDSDALSMLVRTIDDRMRDSPAGSYTRRLLDDPTLLRAKLVEEAGELADARDAAHVASEAADLLYFALVRMRLAGVGAGEVERELARRTLRVTRRGGDAKPGAIASHRAADAGGVR